MKNKINIFFFSIFAMFCLTHLGCYHTFGCTEGETALCLCNGEKTGVQICQENNTWSECECGDYSDSDSDTDADTESVEDCTLNSGFPCACDFTGDCGNPGDLCLDIDDKGYGWCAEQAESHENPPDARGYGTKAAPVFIHKGKTYFALLCDAKHTCPPGLNCIQASLGGWHACS